MPFKINTPKKLATPMPKVVSARPVTFWFARREIVRKLKISPPSIDAAIQAISAIRIQTMPLGFFALFS